MFEDTITAVATGISQGGINIIRISGAESFTITDQIFKSPKGKKIINAKTHTLLYGNIMDRNEIVDEVLVSVMRAPNTYTKEDVIEINCHGGNIVTRKVLNLILSHGARMAEPGEFTKRAFLNGRIDLSQAESVMDVITAQTELALKSSMDQLTGHLKSKIDNLRSELIETLAHIEASIDYPEYDIENLSENTVRLKLLAINKEIRKLVDTADEGKIIKEGIKTVIVGKPNVGKSSLLNALIKESKAIVTHVPGTTRDVLEEYLNIKGIPIKMIDTAGIRETEDIVEKMGIKKTIEQTELADLIILVLDQSNALSEEDISILDLINNKKVIIILNKMDLNRKIDLDQLNQYAQNSKIIETSMTQLLGIEELEITIKNMFLQGDIAFNDQLYITNVRHKNALFRAEESLKNGIHAIEDQLPEDFWSIDIKNAYSYLGEIIGETIEEDLMHTIFARFCLGK